MPPRAARHIGQLARHFHIGGTFGKAHGQIIGLKAHGGFDVVHVFGGERRRRQATAFFIDTFVVGEFAAYGDAGVYLLADHFFDRHHNQAIIEQEHIAFFDIAWQFFVI